jgi:hypothetical protein
MIQVSNMYICLINVTNGNLLEAMMAKSGRRNVTYACAVTMPHTHV